MALLDLRGEILRFACQVEGTHLQGSGGGGLLSGRRKGGEGYTWGRGQGRAVTAAAFWQAGGRSSVLPRRVGPSSQGRCLVRSVGVSGEGWGGRGARGKGTGRGAGCGVAVAGEGRGRGMATGCAVSSREATREATSAKRARARRKHSTCTGWAGPCYVVRWSLGACRRLGWLPRRGSTTWVVGEGWVG